MCNVKAWCEVVCDEVSVVCDEVSVVCDEISVVCDEVVWCVIVWKLSAGITVIQRGQTAKCLYASLLRRLDAYCSRYPEQLKNNSQQGSSYNHGGVTTNAPTQT